MTQYANKTMTLANVAVKKIAFESFRRIVMRTPVDTGRARSNWFVSVGNPSSQTTDSATRAVVGELATGVNGWKPADGASIFFTNNLPYIEVLERGRVGNRGSMQAPNGMVAITMAEFGFIADSWSDWDIGGSGE
jgi:hypothetical protein